AGPGHPGRAGRAGGRFRRHRRPAPRAGHDRPGRGEAERRRRRPAARRRIGGPDRPVVTGTLITVAPTGAESRKTDVPALPVRLDELVATARECEALGAAVIHVHVRDDAGEPTLDPGRLRATVAEL